MIEKDKPNGWYRGIVKLSDLPKDKIYLDLNESYKFKLYKLLINKFRNKQAIANAINENYDSIRNFFDRNQTKSLQFIEKLMMCFGEGINMNVLEKQIKCIQVKNGRKILCPKFPMNFNTEDGAVIISMIYHDGGIHKNSLCPHYRNYERSMIEHVIRVVNKVCGKIEPRLLMNNTQVYFPKILGLIMVYGLGLSYGSKLKTNPKIPHFIHNANETVKCSFLKQAFDDEGSIDEGRNGSGRQLTFSQSSDVSNYDADKLIKIRKSNNPRYISNIIKDDKSLLESLEINVGGPYFKQEHHSKDGRISHNWRITISDRKNLAAFNDKISFHLKYKRNKLKRLLKSYK
ncbi:MAG: hypothetical protein KJ697_01440 [Nanoarchaeota archaeon]|nr:hypothetical protein [Nanoarchaeota archaeon]MBU4124024.1 hypothetical protein [Nanoarchaeota archaeon]